MSTDSSYLRGKFRATLALLHDVVASALSWMLAYLLRFNLETPPGFLDEMWRTMIWVVPLQGLVFWRFGLYRGIWRYASVNDLRRISMAVLLTATAIPLLFWMLRLNAIVPRSVLLIYPLLLLLMVGGSRLIYRLWKEQALYGDIKLHGEPVLILGAGEAGVNLAKELARSSDWRTVGFLDDDEAKHGRLLNGVKVHGKLETIADHAQRLGVQQAIIAMPSATHQQRKRVFDLCSQAGVKTLTVPSFDDLLSGRITVSQLRAVELDDLLGRDPVRPDSRLLERCIRGKSVMVTGAGGSIGSELCRQILLQEPKCLVLFEKSEFSLYQVEQELNALKAQYRSSVEIIPILGSVTHQQRVGRVLDSFGVQTVYHAAAYKHVPLVEHNLIEGVHNNVFGTWRTAEAARKMGVETFVLISTDKAVRPTNVMGASKRFSELILQAFAHEGGATRFCMVRFGNVLGSSGSVVPLFKKQIQEGGPVTVTHPEITRFFMTIPEAAGLVLQAGAMGTGGDVFVLDMGSPMKIVDLACRMIHLSGLEVRDEEHPEGDIAIEYSGLRPGEKLYEELLIGENVTGTEHPLIMRAEEQELSWASLKEALGKLDSAFHEADCEAVRNILLEVVEGYRPQGGICDYVWEMSHSKIAVFEHLSAHSPS